VDYYLVAEIEQPVGSKGFVRVNPVSDFPEHLLKLKEVYLDFWGLKKLFLVEEVKQYRNKFLFKFCNFETIREYGVLTGRKMYLPAKDLVKLPDQHFFIHDLVGLRVYAGQENFGIIKDVLKMPANDVLVIETENGLEKMFPFVLEFIERIEPEKKRISLKISKDFFEDENED